MTAKIAFDVDGLPVVQGNVRTSRTGHAYYPNGPALRPWRASLAHAAREAMAGRDPLEGAVAVRVTFRLPRPRGHYRTAGGLRPSAPAFPDRRPDLDKLTRGLDALTAVVWRDDAQVVVLDVRKVYGVPGAAVEVMEWLD